MSKYLGNFNQAAYQKRIDETVGTAQGRPLIKLGWCPDNFRWMPCKLGDETLGYTFPSFCTGRLNGEFFSPARWGLWQRVEWELYGPTWEHTRYKKHQGFVYDLKGPCPSEKYVELRVHSYHNGKCCNCIGIECECKVHCWGNYADPDEQLMGWIRQVSWESRHDTDVEPFADGRFFEAPKAQQEVISNHKNAWAKDKEETDRFDKEARDLFIRNPYSISGLVRRDSGLFTFGVKEKNVNTG